MKKVTIVSSALINALEAPIVDGTIFAAVREQLAVIQESQTGGSLSVTLSVRGAVSSDAPGAIVAAQEALDKAFAKHGRLTRSDIGIVGIRERKAKGEKGGGA